MLFKIRMPLLAVVLATTAVSAVHAQNFDIPGDDLSSALAAFTTQSGVTLVASSVEIKGLKTPGVKGNLSPEEALTKILRGTGFVYMRDDAGVLEIVRQKSSSLEVVPLQLAQATTPQRTAVETVTVTSSKLGGADVQSIPIAITALSQEQLTSTQTAGGPDLIKEVPNMTFTKTNFTGYSINIRGIGTQAISVTTDPAVAVAFNDVPFIRNHFFEQEFYDVSQVEVLRGPQGTLYGRNATAGVVNLTSAKPTDQFEAMASADIGNYKNRRFEGMVNLPIVDDRVDLRVAGEWTKRNGYSFNEITNQPIDGRDLWSGRATLSFKPTESLQTYLIWEHFSEDDDRLRSSKQLCKTAHSPASVNGIAVPPGFLNVDGALTLTANYLSQGCEATSLYSPDAFQVPNGFSLPYALALGVIQGANSHLDPYAGTTQSTDLRVIESTLAPHYQAKNDVVEFNAEYSINPALKFFSQTAYSQDFLSSTEDYNRFNTSSGIFDYDPTSFAATRGYLLPNPTGPAGSGIFCDPQLGCADRLVGEDLSNEHAWQLSQEFRVASNFSGPINFSVGGNYLHYETEENYYVFINSLTDYAQANDHFGDQSSVDNSDCITKDAYTGGWQNPNPALGGGEPTQSCIYVDTNPLSSLNNRGHNYFLSQNPYTLNSYAGFGEAYYSVTPDIKLTGGLRWTEDQKHFVDIPSQVTTQGYGYPISGTVDQQWDQFTGRAVLNWTPKLDFTDQTLFYASYSRGYKAGGANPPGAIFATYGASTAAPIHPLTFRPEFVDSFEVGSKNSFLDGALTINGSAFYYNYKDYQISEIVDRTSINLNFNATVKGAELEATWEPVPGLRFNFAGGYEHTRIANGQSSVDLMDRTDAANHPDWLVVKPFATEASNCILPKYVVAAVLQEQQIYSKFAEPADQGFACDHAYSENLDPVTLEIYTPNPTGLVGVGYAPTAGFPPIGCCNGATIPNGYIGFDPAAAPNNGAGFAKNLGGNELPNAPPFTVSFGAQYTVPITTDWAGTLRSDYYWQDYSWARVFNDNPYDRLRGYTNINLALIFTNQNGWQVMGYVKNVFDTTAITGDFLNSDDSGLTTNVFLTDPRLFGVRVTKNW